MKVRYILTILMKYMFITNYIASLSYEEVDINKAPALDVKNLEIDEWSDEKFEPKTSNNPEFDRQSSEESCY